MSEVKKYLIQKTPIGTLMKVHAQGNWVELSDYDAAQAREAALREELATIYSDRDAEKEMKAKARDQRDVQTIRACELQQRLTVAEKFVQKLVDCSKGQDSIATGYLSDILDSLKPAAEGEGS